MAQNGTPAEPPKGSAFDSPYAQRVEIDRMLGNTTPRTDDPAFMPPVDPVPGAIGRSKLIYRDLPLTTIQTSWTVQGTRNALCAHTTGTFWDSAQLCDAIAGDDRVQATMGSRIGGLFGRPIRHTPADDSMRAREVCEAWSKNWERICPEASLREMHFWDIMMGFSIAEPVWDTTGPIAIPYVKPWHPAYSYWHWPLRKFIVITLDGQEAIIPGDGKWILHAPYGAYRGWMRGVVRAITEPWIIRHFAIRDWARFSEVHGLPTKVGKVPAAAEAVERANFENNLLNLGSAAAMILPQAVDGTTGYDYGLVEATDTAWKAFPGLRDHCDMSITLAIKFQNLTTEVSGGSYAAASQHGKGELFQLAADNRALSLTLYEQLARPFAYINFGDADLAPHTCWEIDTEDYEDRAKRFQAMGTAIEVLRRGGVQFATAEDVTEVARQFGIKLPNVMLVDPVASMGMGGFGK